MIETQPPQESEGAFRDGTNLVIVPRNARLPGICAGTGKPTDAYFRIYRVLPPQKSTSEQTKANILAAHDAIRPLAMVRRVVPGVGVLGALIAGAVLISNTRRVVIDVPVECTLQQRYLKTTRICTALFFAGLLLTTALVGTVCYDAIFSVASSSIDHRVGAFLTEKFGKTVAITSILGVMALGPLMMMAGAFVAAYFADRV